MAYQIDFTASQYSRRTCRKWILRTLLLAATVGAAWGAYDVYTTYNEPTLNMRLAMYEMVAHPVEEIDAAWDGAAKKYNALTRYYRLLWASNPTNFLAVMLSPDAPRLGRGSHPLRWSLKTGGACQLDYRYSFRPGDKAEQAKGLEAEIAQAVTSRLAVAEGNVDVQGVRHENLLSVDGLDIKVRFALPDIMAFPTKERTLADCAAEIVAFRKKVHEAKVAKGDKKGSPTTAQGIMMAYLPMGKDKPGYPDFTKVLNVAGWFSRADKFIQKNRIPVDDAKQKGFREIWNEVGEARFPWDRYRLLDNETLVQRTKVLGTVADGVSRFKVFLDKRQADGQRKLEPFVEAYEHDDIFNRPLVESDLRDRVARAVGLDHVSTSFRDESGVEPAVLVKDDEKFTFSWVRWTLAIGARLDQRGERPQQADTSEPKEPVTLGQVQDCIRRALALGPGYALDSVKIDFDENRNVTSAVLEGLFPVKRVEAVSKGGK